MLSVTVSPFRALPPSLYLGRFPVESAAERTCARVPVASHRKRESRGRVSGGLIAPQSLPLSHDRKTTACHLRGTNSRRHTGHEGKFTCSIHHFVLPPAPHPLCFVSLITLSLSLSGSQSLFSSFLLPPTSPLLPTKSSSQIIPYRQSRSSRSYSLPSIPLPPPSPLVPLLLHYENVGGKLVCGMICTFCRGV